MRNHCTQQNKPREVYKKCEPVVISKLRELKNTSEGCEMIIATPGTLLLTKRLHKESPNRQ